MIDREFFRDPTTNPEFSTSGFWFWNTIITDAKTKEQLDIMKAVHANQPVVHARSGLETEYLSRDWFDRVAFAVETAKANGQKLWLYDENNWPSGNCNWTITKEERYREHFLQFAHYVVEAGERFILDSSTHTYINVTAYLPDGDVNLLPDGDEIRFDAECTCEIWAVYVAVDSYEPVGKYNVDYLSEEAIRVFIESTHEKYAAELGDAFAETILGIFMDETRFCNANPWTKRLPEEFRARKGYDLLPLLPLLRRKEPRSDMIRFDYYDVISDLYCEATFGQVYDWCESHGIRSTGHFLGEETIATQSYFGADMLRGYKYFHIPAIDHLGNGIGSLDGKFAASACYAYGKTRIGCEAFGAAGWDMNYEDLVRVSNWLFQQGINLFWMHGFYYSIEGHRYNDFPPSYFYQWKYWDRIQEFILMSNRMQEMLSGGRHEAEILVYTPMESFWNHYEPDLSIKTGFNENGPWIKDETARFINCQHQLLCNRLIDRNLDFDILHGDAVGNFAVSGKKLINRLTGTEYDVFVLPVTDTLTEEMVVLLNDFTAAGGVVISYRSSVRNIFCKDGGHMWGKAVPALAETNFTHTDNMAEVIALCHNAISLPFTILCGVDEVAHSLSSYPDRLIDPYIHDGERLYGVGVTRYIKDGHRIINVTNYNQKEEPLTLWVASECEPELFVPATGEMTAIPGCVLQNGGYLCNITVLQNRAVFLVCRL